MAFAKRSAVERVANACLVVPVVYFYYHGVLSARRTSSIVYGEMLKNHERFVTDTIRSADSENQQWDADRIPEYAVESMTDSEFSGLWTSWLTPLTGTLMDKKDSQWHAFRDAFPLLLLGSVAFIVASKIMRRLSSDICQEALVKRMSRFYIFAAVPFTVILHEIGCLFVIFLSCAHYVITQLVPIDLLPAASWVFCICSLFAVEACANNFSFAAGGMIKWSLCYNLVILRMLSFSMDKYWSANESKTKSTVPQSRVEAPHPPWASSSFEVYLAYVFYPPLYLSGPIITFNSFCSHVARPQKDHGIKKLFLYFLRFGFSFLIMEFFCSYFYMGILNHFAVGYNDKWSRNETMIAIVSNGGKDIEPLMFFTYFSLTFLWFKFMLIWRFFRLWALCDGVNPPENMKRCMSNNFTIRGFWRGWHCSFNKFLVRYVYIPLGGSREGPLRTFFSIFVTFSFVAIWHDMEMKLLAWGWMLSIFLFPEILALNVARKPSVRAFMGRYPALARCLISAFGGFTILILMAANSIGYTIGMDGAASLAASAASTKGLCFLAWFWFMMACGTKIMVEIRILRGEIAEDCYTLAKVRRLLMKRNKGA